MTCVAVIVDPFVEPNTRARAPVVTALADAELAPLR
jgi:hypothetical protein